MSRSYSPVADPTRARCAALSLFSSFASSVASRLLPPLLGIVEALPAVSAPFGEASLRHLERQPDFDLAQPGHTCESRHPYESECTCEHLVSTATCSSIWLHLDPRCCTVEGEATAYALAYALAYDLAYANALAYACALAYALAYA